MEDQEKSHTQGQECSEDLFADMDSAPLVLQADSELEPACSLKPVQNRLLDVGSPVDVDATPDLFSEEDDETDLNHKKTSNVEIQIEESEKMEIEAIDTDISDNLDIVNQEINDEKVEDDESDEDEIEETVDELLNENETGLTDQNNEKNKLPKKSVIKDSSKLIHLPLGRIKNIMKLDPDANMMSKEAIFMVAKATELFIECLSKECMVQKDPKKKTIQKRDVDQVFASADSLMFLEGAIDF